mmetsp:Transcript_9126/g.55508  ORF Transcript_9126/g.55508 Transcript_9126/m.55508 type:complete len:211 (-) Transcript_9126:221-853(-)
MVMAVCVLDASMRGASLGFSSAFPVAATTSLPSAAAFSSALAFSLAFTSSMAFSASAAAAISVSFCISERPSLASLLNTPRSASAFFCSGAMRSRASVMPSLASPSPSVFAGGGVTSRMASGLSGSSSLHTQLALKKTIFLSSLAASFWFFCERALPMKALKMARILMVSVSSAMSSGRRRSPCTPRTALACSLPNASVPLESALSTAWA